MNPASASWSRSRKGGREASWYTERAAEPLVPLESSRTGSGGGPSRAETRTARVSAWRRRAEVWVLALRRRWPTSRRGRSAPKRRPSTLRREQSASRRRSPAPKWESARLGADGLRRDASGARRSAGGARQSVGCPIRRESPPSRREQSGPPSGYNPSMAGFQLISKFTPQGDQPEAIRQLVEGLERGDKEQVLLGVTGSGKTFTMAKVIERVHKPDARPLAQQDARGPALPGVQGVLPEQRRRVFRLLLRLLPAGGLRPATDTYIEKETRSTRRSTASASRDPGPVRAAGRRDRRLRLLHLRPRLAGGVLGMLQFFRKGDRSGMDAALSGSSHPVRAQRLDLVRGTFRVRGDVLEIFPAYEEIGCGSSSWATRWSASSGATRCGARCSSRSTARGLPASHFVTPRSRGCAHRGRDASRGAEVVSTSSSRRGSSSKRSASSSARCSTSRCSRRSATARASRTTRATSRGRAPGEQPSTLLDYFPDDFLLIVDESHHLAAAGARHVRRRPLAQGETRRVRLPPAVRARQPPADLR